VEKPQSFYSRKAYFAINVQVIVVKRERILFQSIEARGVEHDSTAFKSSGHWRVRQGLHFIGDLACSVKSFLLDLTAMQPMVLQRIITTSFILLPAFQLSVALEKPISDLGYSGGS
jgi:hypothetical protein